MSPVLSHSHYFLFIRGCQPPPPLSPHHHHQLAYPCHTYFVRLPAAVGSLPLAGLLRATRCVSTLQTHYRAALLKCHHPNLNLNLLCLCKYCGVSMPLFFFLLCSLLI
ncbi:hypothetical protein QBC44DRAFT_106875 [Cladorrhinum sp. PSN332]|nr:hypothetical protein QBC44DRAFT_106875 [Cladorrhinum sp. PSN332]